METTSFINRDLNYDELITKEYISRRRNFVPHRFDGKVAIVTGGSAGIGRAIAEELMKEGCRVTITGRNPQTGAETVAEMAKEGLTEVMYLAGDMMSEEFCREIAEKTYEKWGRIDYLVNNAFLFIMKGLDATTRDWERAFFTGPVGYARMIQNCVPYMRKVGGGAVVNISSISGRIAQPHFWTYSMMKGAVNMLTKNAALDLAHSNIRVNTLSPATIFTRITTGDLITGTKEARRKHMKSESHGYMLNRAGEPVECASVALFLLSDDATYVTGSDYLVDGGLIALGNQGAVDKARRDMEVYGLDYRKSIILGRNSFEDLHDDDEPRHHKDDIEVVYKNPASVDNEEK